MAWDLRSQAEADHLTPQLVTRIIDRGCDPGKVTSRWPMVTTWPVALLTKFCWRAVLCNVFFRGITLLSDVYFTPWLLASLVDTLSKSVLLEGDSKPSEVDVLVACMVYCLARMVSNYAQTTSNYFGSLNRERILVIIPTWVYRRCLVTPLNVLLGSIADAPRLSSRLTTRRMPFSAARRSGYTARASRASAPAPLSSNRSAPASSSMLIARMSNVLPSSSRVSRLSPAEMASSICPRSTFSSLFNGRETGLDATMPTHARAAGPVARAQGGLSRSTPSCRGRGPTRHPPSVPSKINYTL